MAYHNTLGEDYTVTYESGAIDRYTLNRNGSRRFVSCVHYGRDGYLIHSCRPFCVGVQSKGSTGEVSEPQFNKLRDFLREYSDQAEVQSCRS